MAERGQHGWDGPVAILVPGDPENPKWSQDAKTLAALIQDSAPVGQGAHAGQLKTDLSLRRAGYKRLPRPRKGFQLEVRNVYALIQDIGGDIPERRPKGYLLTTPDGGDVIGPRAGRALKFDVGGETVFATYAKGFSLPGFDYLNRGFTRWLTSRAHGASALAWVDRQYETGGHGG